MGSGAIGDSEIARKRELQAPVSTLCRRADVSGVRNGDNVGYSETPEVLL